MVLVVGDLSLDVDTTVPSARLLGPLARGDDVTIYAEARLAVGGSAWQFARAVLDGAQAEPIVLAAVGDDPAGATVRTALGQSGLRLDGVMVVPGAVTSVSSMTYFEHRQRLMVFPTRHANQRLSLAKTTEVLRSLPPARVACTWLSGHALLAARSERRPSIVALCGWARHHHIPLVLDVVPHDFADAVGSLAEVEDVVGPVDGLVGELATFRGLGYPKAPRTVADESDVDDDAIAAVARDLRGHRRFAVVQHRPAKTVYLQAVAFDGGVRTIEYDITARGLRGLGDVMAVDALVEAGILTAAVGY